MDVSVLSDRNTSTKVIEKISKNEDLEIEITKTWVLKVETVPTPSHLRPTPLHVFYQSPRTKEWVRF